MLVLKIDECLDLNAILPNENVPQETQLGYCWASSGWDREVVEPEKDKWDNKFNDLIT